MAPPKKLASWNMRPFWWQLPVRMWIFHSEIGVPYLQPMAGYVWPILVDWEQEGVSKYEPADKWSHEYILRQLVDSRHSSFIFHGPSQVIASTGHAMAIGPVSRIGKCCWPYGSTSYAGTPICKALVGKWFVAAFWGVKFGNDFFIAQNW